ncbi:hypothetical protein GCM10011571_22190 [Marinithermofilum abyssi]|uniref:Uncharacterized protein n=1 Tax=Marinithermofilum abyssi TaxID=1571185 RepID=A0A8J2VFF3_9BACL|nr:hypothetical protein [Marinithermofilum abyssi]GGE19798.1 hypothetical protein GCM10011571_22190 [Marinithermofilum abyssi]
MKIVLDFTAEEWSVTHRCIERRYRDLRQKILEGDRKGRGVRRYIKEAELLEKLLQKMKVPPEEG